ncbi:hydroxyethylthiazole kinase [Cetobacterium sp.]|uniref:hydroxyethylthiazole kinase n=1 Tax=Cetobacterium sp. TaxID=2071632 RepID=UPI003F3EAF4F
MNRYVSEESVLNAVTSGLSEIKEKTPLVYHLTNMVTINDCANVTLAIGASPLMSFCIDEIEEIIGFSSSVVLNIGTMDKSMREMALEVGKIANRLNKPIVLDPVGAGATRARRELVQALVQEVKFSVIKGNMAEIKCLLGMDVKSRGVDSLENENSGEEISKLAAKILSTTIAITGKIDYIANEEVVIKVMNGSSSMSLVSGTGCMISSLIGAFLGAENNSFISALGGVLSMGIAGEISSNQEYRGTGSLKVSIIDNISNMNEDLINKYSKVSVSF